MGEVNRTQSTRSQSPPADPSRGIQPASGRKPESGVVAQAKAITSRRSMSTHHFADNPSRRPSHGDTLGAHQLGSKPRPVTRPGPGGISGRDEESMTVPGWVKAKQRAVAVIVTTASCDGRATLGARGLEVTNRGAVSAAIIGPRSDPRNWA